MVSGEAVEDEFAGQGGSYILDPLTNKRTRVEEPTQGRVRPAEVYAEHPLLVPPEAELAADAPVIRPRKIAAVQPTPIEEIK